MEKGDKKNIIILVIIAIILISGIIVYETFFNKSTVNEETEVAILKDNSRFYTVSSCINRYLTYLTNKDINNLFLLVDEEYKKENNIDKNNILEYLPKLNKRYNFKARKMYEQELNDKYTKYYIYGLLIEDLFNEEDSIKNTLDFYTIVTINSKDHTYSITPYDGEMFIGGSND